MASLSRKIQDWVKSDLISAEQGQAIVTFEGSRKSVLSPMLALGLVGVLAVGIGILAIVAANWQMIPPGVKLFNLFVVMILVAGTAVYFQNKKTAVFEALLFLEMLLFFAAIGLIGQIYHLQSEAYKGFLFWSLLAFPLLFLTQKVFFGFIWEFVLISAFFSSPMVRPVFRYLENHFPGSFGISGLFMFILACLLLTQKAKVFVVPLRLFAAFWAIAPLFITSYYRTGVAPDILIAVIVLAGVAGYGLYRLKTPYKSLYVVCVLYAAFATATIPFVVFTGQVLILLSLMFAAYQAKAQGITRILTFCAGLRILTAYFELFGSLMQTGGGLILTGLIILGLSFGWYRLDQTLKARLK